MQQTPYQKGYSDAEEGRREPYQSGVLSELIFGRSYGAAVKEMNEDYDEGQEDYERKHGKR